MMINFTHDINGEPIPDCPRCNGTGKPHSTDNERIKKCMCVLHWYVCPTLVSAGNNDLRNRMPLEKCDCAIKYYQELYNHF